MLVYLPIAEIAVNMFTVLGMGAAVGFISGLFGVGGGFLLTPLLIFSGIPPAVSVATVTAQLVASSTSGALAYWRRGQLDLKLAMMLLVGGVVGAILGVVLFSVLRRIGQLDLIITVSYVTFLGLIGALMLRESLRAAWNARRGRPAPLRRPGQHLWIHGLPLKMRFKRSRLYVSIIPVLALGCSIGFLGTVLGIGGGFIMVPALIYLLRVPTNMVIGTSLVQIVGTMAVATILHAVSTYSVDAVLAFMLMVGGVVGAQFGAQVGHNIRGEYLRVLLGLLVLAVGIRFFIGLVTPPTDPFSLSLLAGSGQ